MSPSSSGDRASPAEKAAPTPARAAPPAEAAAPPATAGALLGGEEFLRATDLGQSAARMPMHRSSSDALGHHGGRRYNGGCRRPVGGAIARHRHEQQHQGGSNFNDGATASGHGNGGGVRHVQEHREGFNARHHGRGHPDGYGSGRRWPGPHVPFAWALHPFNVQPPPPPPPPFYAQYTAPFYGSCYGPMIPYAQPEDAPGLFVAPQPDAPHFMAHLIMEQQESHLVVGQEEVLLGEEAAARPSREELQLHILSREELPQKLRSLSREELENKLCTQIEYYFSENNLCKDEHVKRHMNEEGWVALEVIAAFSLCSAICEALMEKFEDVTTNLQFVMKAISSSTEVEMQRNKIRRRQGWQKYILPPEYRTQ